MSFHTHHWLLSTAPTPPCSTTGNLPHLFMQMLIQVHLLISGNVLTCHQGVPGILSSRVLQ